MGCEHIASGKNTNGGARAHRTAQRAPAGNDAAFAACTGPEPQAGGNTQGSRDTAQAQRPANHTRQQVAETAAIHGLLQRQQSRNQWPVWHNYTGHVCAPHVPSEDTVFVGMCCCSLLRHGFVQA